MLIFFESSLAVKMGSKNREFRERAVVETFQEFWVQCKPTTPFPIEQRAAAC